MNKRDDKKAAVDESKPVDERLNDQVTPLWRMSYPEQLTQKAAAMKTVLEDAATELKRFVKLARDGDGDGMDYSWLEGQTSFCPVAEITPSPVLKDYRNKCEFSLGKDEDGKVQVGFMLGLFKEGRAAVVVGIFFLSFLAFLVTPICVRLTNVMSH